MSSPVWIDHVFYGKCSYAGLSLAKGPPHCGVDRNEDAGSSADNRYDPLMDSSSIKENGMNKDLQRTEHNAPTPVNQKTIGIDLGDRWSRYCILGGDGQIVEEDRIPTSTGALERAFKKMP